VAALYPLLRDAHDWISRGALAAGLVLLALAVFIGLIRHGDATPTFRRGVYLMVAVMVVEALIGLVMLAMPFFIFVERTATKRPAMGSYIWGFALMSAIVLRAIMTGSAG
jgi:thiol:disulfide interchange protein